MSDHNNRARTRYASDDHADDLLADIFDSTEGAAQEEAARLQRTLDEKRDAEQAERASAKAAELAERQAKLERELNRQAELQERRTLRMKALNPVPCAEQTPGVAAVETTPALDEAAIRKQIADEVREELRAIGLTPMPTATATPTPPAKRSHASWLAAAAVLVTGAVGVAAFALSSSYNPDPTAYSKAVFAPMDRDAVALEMHAVPLPKAEPAIVAQPEVRERKARPRVRRTPKPETTERSVFDRPATKSDAARSFEALEGMLSEDILGGDKK